MERIFVKPATPELKVRKPVNGHLAPAGEMVNAESYWLRRIADGDVVSVVSVASAEEPKTFVATALQPRTKSA